MHKPGLPACEQDSVAPWDPRTSLRCYTTIVRDGCVSGEHVAAAFYSNQKKKQVFFQKRNRKHKGKMLRLPAISHLLSNIMQPLSGGSSFSHSPTHEL